MCKSKKDKEENADWVPYLDEANRTYYVNKQTGATQYENPYSYSDNSEDENEVAEKAPRREKRRAQSCHETDSLAKAPATHPYPPSSSSSSSHHTSSRLVKQPSEQLDHQADTSKAAAAALSSGSASANSSSGWTPIEDGQGGVYFYNVHTGESKWDVPADVSAEWVCSTKDDGSGNVHYTNSRTGESRWELPSNEMASASSSLLQSLPKVARGRWQRLFDDAGRSYFFNERTGETTWEVPASELSAVDNWEEARGADGRVGLTGDVRRDAPEAAKVNHGGGAATASHGGVPAEAVSGVGENGVTRRGGSETTESSGTKLADGSWEVMTTEGGELSFVERAAGQSRWTLPQIMESATPTGSLDALGPLRTSISSKTTTGSDSRPAADSWELQTTEDGPQYFCNRVSGESRWTPPEGRSAMDADSRPATNTQRSSRTTTSTTDTKETENSWEMLTTDDGQQYFICRATGESRWTVPQNIKVTQPSEASAGALVPYNGSPRTKPTVGSWQVFTTENGAAYFVNRATGHSRWTPSQSQRASASGGPSDALVPGPTTGRTSRESWELCTTEDGCQYFVNCATGESRWTPPQNQRAPLSSGASDALIPRAITGRTSLSSTKSSESSWELCTTEDGCQYFVNRATDESRWTPPQNQRGALLTGAPDGLVLGPITGRTSLSSSTLSSRESWELCMTEDGRQYFVNRATGESRWTPPQNQRGALLIGAPNGLVLGPITGRTSLSSSSLSNRESWELCMTEDGRQYFVNRATGESRWTPPQNQRGALLIGAPNGLVLGPITGRTSLSSSTLSSRESWELCMTEDGRQYFVNRATGESRWTPPQNQRGALLTGAPNGLVLGPITGRTSISSSTLSSRESWEPCMTEDGRQYFVNRATGESRWTPLQNRRVISLTGASDGCGQGGGVVTGRTTHSSNTQSSMESWELCTTQYGQHYFVNIATGVSRWTPPQSLIEAPLQGTPDALVPVPHEPPDSASQGSLSNKSLVDDHISVSSGSSKSSASSTTTRSSAKKHVSFTNAAGSMMSMSSADNISNWVVTAQPQVEGQSAQMLQMEDAVSGVTEPPIPRALMGVAGHGAATAVVRAATESDGVELWEESITDDGHSVYTNVSSGETRTTLSQPSLPAPPSSAKIERSASRQLPDQHPLLAGVVTTDAMALDVTSTMTNTTTGSRVLRLRRSSTRDERISVAGFIARKVVLRGIAALVPEIATRLHREMKAKVAEQFKQQKMVYKAAHNYNRKVQEQAPNVGTAEYLALQAQTEGVESDEDYDSYSPRTLRTSSNVSDSGSLSRSSMRVTNMRQLEESGWRRRSSKPRPSARLHLVLSMLAQGQLDGHLLRDINLTCEQIGDSGVQQLCPLLVRSAVTTLILVSNGITDNGVSTLAQALQKNRSVYSLHLGGNLITDAGVRSLTLSLADSPALRVLNLNGNPLTSSAGKDLALLLMDKKCRLSRLFVGGPLLAKDKVPQQQAAGKASAGVAEAEMDSSTAPTQKRLGDLGVCYLAVALLQGAHCKLDTLWIPNVDMGIEGAKALAAVLCYNQRLHSLNISMNRIGERGAEHLLKALRVNTGLRILIADCCGISLATSQALQQALVKKPCLSWEDQKDYAAEVMEHLRWLRGVMINVRFPLRAKDGRNEELVGAVIVERIQGGKDRQQGELTESPLHRTVTKSAPAWVKAPETSLLRTLLDTTTFDTVKAWSTAWVENTASVVEMYISTLEALERDTRDTSAVTEATLSEIRGDLHTLLSTSQGVLHLHKLVQKAKRDHEAAGAERGVAECVEDDYSRRLRACREGVFTDVSTGNLDDVRGLDDVSDEAVAAAERHLKQAREWTVKAKHMETLARARLDELEGRLNGAVRGAQDAEDVIKSETLELLLERLRCRYRRVRIEQLLREARAVHELLRRALKDRAKQQKCRDLVPVTCGFPELDDRVRHCIMKQYQRKISLAQAQNAATLIDEELQDALEDVHSVAAITRELSTLNNGSDNAVQASMEQVALLEKMLTFLDAMAEKLSTDGTQLPRTRKEDCVAEISGTEQFATQPLLLQPASTEITPHSEKPVSTEAGTKQLSETPDTCKSATYLPALTQAVQAKARNLQDPVVDSYEQLCEKKGMVMEDLADINAELRDCQQLLEALTVDHYRLAKDRLPQSLQATTVMTMLPHSDPVDDLLKDTDLARPLRAGERLTRLRARDLPEIGPIARKEGKKSSSVPVVSLSLHKHWDVLRDQEVFQITRDDLRQIRSMVKQRRLKQDQERLMSTPGFQEVLESLRSEPMPQLVKKAKEQGMSVKDLKTKEQLSMRLAALEFSRARCYA